MDTISARRDTPALAAPPPSFARRMLTLSSGHLLSYVLLALAAPILSRLYGPQEFAVMGTFTAMLTLVGPIVTLRYERALIMIRRPLHVHLHAVSVFFLSTLACLTATVVLLLGRHQLSAVLKFELSPQACCAVAAGFWSFAIYSLTSCLLIQRGAYGHLARQRMIFAAVTLLAQVGIGLLAPSTEGILLASGLGYFLASIFWLREPLAAAWNCGTGALRLQLAQLSQFRKYPSVDVLASIVAGFNIQGPILLVTACFGPEVGGNFTLGHRALAVPASVLTYSASRIFHREAALCRDNPNELQTLVKRCLLRSSAISLPMCLLIGVTAPAATSLFFGAQWTAAGELCVLLAPLLAVHAVAVILAPTLDVLRKQEQFLVGEILTSCLLLAGLGLGLLFDLHWKTTLTCMLAGGTMGYVCTVANILRHVDLLPSLNRNHSRSPELPEIPLHSIMEREAA